MDIPHERLLQNVSSALAEAWSYQHAQRGIAEHRLTLTPQGWTTTEDPAEPQYSRARIEHLLAWVLRHCYVVNGGVVRQQIAGLPMGIAPAPQLANIYCYVVERTHVEQQRSLNWHTVRFIDDIFTTEDERLPSQESYGMEYSETGRGSNVTYIGARVYKDASGKMRTCLYDREEDYVFHIPRYPCRGTVSSTAQWRGVITGRLTAAWDFSSTMSDFKQGVVVIFMRAIERGYTAAELRHVWRKFLYTHRRAIGIDQRALRKWFTKGLSFAQKEYQRWNSQNTREPWAHPRTLPRSKFLDLFGWHGPRNPTNAHPHAPTSSQPSPPTTAVPHRPAKPQATPTATPAPCHPQREQPPSNTASGSPTNNTPTAPHTNQSGDVPDIPRPPAAHTVPTAEAPRSSPTSTTHSSQRVARPAELSDEQMAAMLNALATSAPTPTPPIPHSKAPDSTRSPPGDNSKLPRPRFLPSPMAQAELIPPYDSTSPQAPPKHAAASRAQASLPKTLSHQALVLQTVDRLDLSLHPATPPLAPAAAVPIPPVTVANTSTVRLPTTSFSIPTTATVLTHPSAVPQLLRPPQPAVSTGPSGTPLLLTTPCVPAALKGPRDGATASSPTPAPPAQLLPQQTAH